MAGEAVVLSVALQAQVDAFVANLLRAANQSDQTSNATTQMSTNISRNIANVNRLNLSQFTSALNAGTLSVQRFNNTPLNPRPVIVGANQAANALTNLGRVAQDAPFGFIGIQNNLNPLLESFQRLRAETGSNGAAFRALGQSLMGPAGIGIALSVVTSAITLYTQYQQRANKTLNDAKKNASEYIDTLEGVEGAMLRGTQNAAKEIAELNVLFNLYKNANIPLNKRKEAYKEIQDQYPAYFANIKFERNLTEKTNDAYLALTQSILATARARALSEKVGQNAIKEEETLNKIRNTEDAIRKSRQGDTSLAAALGGSKETQDLLEQQFALQKEFNNLKQQDLRLEKEITNQVSTQNASIKDGFGKVGGVETDKVTVKPKAIDLELPEDGSKVLADLYEKISDINAPGTLTVKAPDKLKVDGKVQPIDLGQLFEFDSGTLDKAIQNLKLQQKLNDIVIGAEQEIIKLTSLPSLVGLTADALGQSFEAMGAAISEGGNVLVAAGAVIQKTFADLLSALGKQFITMGAAKVAAGILATPFGGKLIADGAGLIALGAGLSLGGGIVGSAGKGKPSSGVTAFANGGIISGPTLGLMGEYAGAKSDPEVVAPLSKLKNMLGETDSKGNVISSRNNDPIIFIPETVIRGQDIVTSYRKASATRDRQG